MKKKRRLGLSYNLIYDNRMHIATFSSLPTPLKTPMGQQSSSWGALTPGNVLNHSDVSDSWQPHGLQPDRLLYPWEFLRQEYWSGLPCPSPENLPCPEIKPRSPPLQRILYCLSHQGRSHPWEYTEINKYHAKIALQQSTCTSSIFSHTLF